MFTNLYLLNVQNLFYRDNTEICVSQFFTVTVEICRGSSTEIIAINLYNGITRLKSPRHPQFT